MQKMHHDGKPLRMCAHVHVQRSRDLHMHPGRDPGIVGWILLAELTMHVATCAGAMHKGSCHMV
jgi:hypothetical protein